MTAARSLVKICGVTNVDDARAVVDAEADALGLIFATSPRRVTGDVAQRICEAVAHEILRCAVFREQSDADVLAAVDAVEVDMVQLHGQLSVPLLRELRERGLFIIKALAVSDENFATYNDGAIDAVLVDGPQPGSGVAHSWDVLDTRSFSASLIASGGLTPDNVAGTIVRTGAWGVDCASGVESSPGVKDERRVREFVNRAREAFDERALA